MNWGYSSNETFLFQYSGALIYEWPGLYIFQDTSLFFASIYEYQLGMETLNDSKELNLIHLTISAIFGIQYIEQLIQKQALKLFNANPYLKVTVKLNAIVMST